MKKLIRFTFFDFWRGCAVVGMIVFHFIFDLTFFVDAIDVDLDRGTYIVLARFVQISFLTLVGISLYLSKENNSDNLFKEKQGIRICILSILAFAVSLASAFVDRSLLIHFGILHLIAVSIFIFSYVPRIFRYLLGLVLLGFQLASAWLSNIGFVFLPLGFTPDAYSSFDYFPLFPWILLVWLGYGSAPYLLRLPGSLLTYRFPKLLLFLGRHSLIIYILHQPIILVLLAAFGFI